MAQIGTFTLKDGKFQGKIHTLTMDAGVIFIPTDATADKAPNYRLFSGTSEVGAAWEKTSDKGTDYLSVLLDDPAFPEPVFANLYKQEDGTYALVWNRPRRQ